MKSPKPGTKKADGSPVIPDWVTNALSTGYLDHIKPIALGRNSGGGRRIEFTISQQHWTWVQQLMIRFRGIWLTPSEAIKFFACNNIMMWHHYHIGNDGIEDWVMRSIAAEAIDTVGDQRETLHRKVQRRYDQHLKQYITEKEFNAFVEDLRSCISSPADIAWFDGMINSLMNEGTMKVTWERVRKQTTRVVREYNQNRAAEKGMSVIDDG